MTGMRRTVSTAFAGVLAGALGIACAHADIYTWVDKKGITNVSNLPPPEGVRLTNVSHTPPMDAAREAAAREASRQAELRILNVRLQQLEDQLEQARREPPIAYAPPPMLVVAPAAPASYIVNVLPAPAPTDAAGPAGCDYSFGGCGFGVWPGYYYAPGIVPVRGGKSHRRYGASQTYTPLVPPLIPMPQPPRMGGAPRPR